MWFWTHKLKSLLSKGEYETIILLCQERLLQHAPEYWTLRALGLSLMHVGRTSEAFEWLTKCLRQYPGKSAIQYDLGLIYLRQECYSQARDHMLAALEGGYRTDALFLDLGRVYYYLGEFEKATNCFREVVRRHPKHAEACTLLGVVYKRRALYEEAVVVYQQAIRWGGETADKHTSLAEIYVRQEKWQDAIREYHRVLELDPSNFSAHYALGSIYEILGENTRAIDQLLNAHRIDADDERTRQKLERLLIS
ncbi:MAG: tetratricopeptide repeat protein [candidate division Zixibacteria bacterium]|nr:tetratricopeptide repeat protein [candidate division Zixibacteria bacterium]